MLHKSTIRDHSKQLQALLDMMGLVWDGKKLDVAPERVAQFAAMQAEAEEAEDSQEPAEGWGPV